MKTHPAQQEILLMTDTTFAASQWSKKDETDNSTNSSEMDQLEEACWNGLIQEMLPEISSQPEGNANMYIWQIRISSSFIELELSEYPATKDKYYSINPYSFLEVQFYS